MLLSLYYLETFCIVIWMPVAGYFAQDQVRVGTDSLRTYAMKKMKKAHIVKTRQQEHIMNEKTIMLDCQSDFIARFAARSNRCIITASRNL